jgi:hypothetical protein
VLEAVSRALRLTPAERTHLVLLGRGEELPPCKAPAERVSPTLRRLIDNLDPNPAYVLGRRWDYLAWNRASELVLWWKPDQHPLSRNHVWRMFMDPVKPELMPDWEKSARLMVARFRADCARNIGDPAFDQLIEALRSSSAEFRKLWKRHEVAGTAEGRKTIEHPIVGTLQFEHAVFLHAEHTHQRLVLYTPVPDGETTARLERLMAADPVSAR